VRAQAQWCTRARQGARQIGVIAGEPGIGKTALVAAFITQAAAGEDLRVAHGQCIEPYGAGEPYLPVLEALGRLCRGPEGPRVVVVLRQYAPSEETMRAPRARHVQRNRRRLCA
jgi:predicted ATPase